MQHKKAGNVTFLTFPNLSHHKELLHAISTRHGGVSSDNYSSLNLGFHVGDKHDRVKRNHQIVSQALRFDLSSLVSCQQVHHHSIARIDKSYHKKNCFLPDNALPETDGLVTDVPGITLMTRYADCVPLLFYSPKTHTVALAHAGWKGTLGHIGPKTVELLTREFKCQRQDIHAALGPSIGPCCYEISNMMAVQAVKELVKGEEYSKELPGKKLLFNLWQANKEELYHAGIREENLSCAEICTSCNVDQFFSYRREKQLTGRFGAFIGLRDQ
jgi:YfiH family protein